LKSAVARRRSFKTKVVIYNNENNNKRDPPEGSTAGAVTLLTTSVIPTPHAMEIYVAISTDDEHEHA
jgi:hypothetical protein